MVPTPGSNEVAEKWQDGCEQATGTAWGDGAFAEIYLPIFVARLNERAAFRGDGAGAEPADVKIRPQHDQIPSYRHARRRPLRVLSSQRALRSNTDEMLQLS